MTSKVKLIDRVRLERNISKTAGDRDSGLFQSTTNWKWHMGYQMVTWPMTSTSHIPWWPQNVKLVTPICLEFNISKAAGDNDTKDH